MEVLSASSRSVLPGVVVRMVGHAELPVTPGVHLLPVQAALAEQVSADRAHGRGLQPDPARAPAIGEGEGFAKIAIFGGVLVVAVTIAKDFSPPS